MDTNLARLVHILRKVAVALNGPLVSLAMKRTCYAVAASAAAVAEVGRCGAVVQAGS